MNFLLKITKNGKVIGKCQTHSIRRFLNNLRTIKWEDGVKIYLRVSYGFAIDNFNKKTCFYNEGWFDNKEDLLLTFKAFIEKEL